MEAAAVTHQMWSMQLISPGAQEETLSGRERRMAMIITALAFLAVVTEELIEMVAEAVWYYCRPVWA